MVDLATWRGCETPAHIRLSGQYVDLVPFEAETHANELFAAISEGSRQKLWQYIPFGPFDNSVDLASVFAEKTAQGWLLFVLYERATKAIRGSLALLRIVPEHGSCEVGCVVFSPEMQGTPLGTEAHYLLARHVFETHGYRRYEWKCNSANKASRHAGARLGFTYEGTFRQHMVMKGGNRDTDWLSMLDTEWPALKRAFESWLAPENFTGDGQQISRLEDIRGSQAE